MPEPATFFLEQAEASPHVYFIYDLLTERVVFVNAAYERVLHGHRAHVDNELPALLARLHPDDQPVWRRYWKLWRRGQLTGEVELRLCTPGQPDQWLCLDPAHWVPAAPAPGWLGGVLRDITEAKQHQANSDRFNSKKNTVLEILAHDLAGAFVLVQQMAHYVQEEQEEPEVPTNPRTPEMLRLIEATSQRSIRLIHDLVDQEFLETSSIPLRRERVDLRQKVEECLEPYRRSPNHELPRLELELPTEPVYAEVDVNKLMQVLSNLVTNAIKFTPTSGRVTVCIAPHNGGVRLTVADEGIGIPAGLQPVLFDRFTKARRPGLRGEPTTGLGLSLCKTIVELHQGTLTFSSSEGQGSTFTVELPDPTAMA